MADLPAIGAAILCGVVLTRWLKARDRAKSRAQEPMTEPPKAGSEADMQVAFSCAGCGQTAGRVQLLLPGELATGPSRPALELLTDLEPILSPWAGNSTTLVVTTFFGVQSQPVPAQRIDFVAQAIRGQDASALYRLTFSYAPFHCPDCKLSYCGEHWKWNSFDDDENGINGIEGTCPRDHFHVLTY